MTKRYLLFACHPYDGNLGGANELIATFFTLDDLFEYIEKNGVEGDYPGVMFTDDEYSICHSCFHIYDVVEEKIIADVDIEYGEYATGAMLVQMLKDAL